MQTKLVIRSSCAALVAATAIAFTLQPRSADAAAVAVAADKYTVDTIHSTLVFRIKHLTCTYFYGRFNDISGTFAIDAANPAASKIEIEVKVDSIDTNNDARDKHLKSAEFFDAAKFATIKFVSSSLKKTGDNKFDVEGDLTLHGVTKKITAPLEWVGTGKGMRGEDRGGFEVIFTIKRGDFGVSGLPQGLGDEVRLMAGIEGVKQ